MTIGLNIDFIGQKIQVKMSKKGNLVENRIVSLMVLGWLGIKVSLGF
jgi:hypothetical protein